MSKLVVPIYLQGITFLSDTTLLYSHLKKFYPSKNITLSSERGYIWELTCILVECISKNSGESTT